MQHHRLTRRSNVCPALLLDRELAEDGSHLAVIDSSVICSYLTGNLQRMGRTWPSLTPRSYQAPSELLRTVQVPPL